MINGEQLKQAIISGAHNISTQKNHINDLNIFPVPDGDTGTNMSMTVMAAAAALEDYDGTNVGEVAELAAKAMLRGARGNSGVITSCSAASARDSRAWRKSTARTLPRRWASA